MIAAGFLAAWVRCHTRLILAAVTIGYAIVTAAGTIVVCPRRVSPGLAAAWGGGWLLLTGCAVILHERDRRARRAAIRSAAVRATVIRQGQERAIDQQVEAEAADLDGRWRDITAHGWPARKP